MVLIISYPILRIKFAPFVETMGPLMTAQGSIPFNQSRFGSSESRLFQFSF